MRKFLFVFLSLLITASVFTGCDPGSSSGEKDDTSIVSCSFSSADEIILVTTSPEYPYCALPDERSDNGTYDVVVESSVWPVPLYLWMSSTESVTFNLQRNESGIIVISEPSA